MPEVMALSCPVCAAPLRPGSERCTYCGSHIFIKVDLPKLDRYTLNQAVIREHIEDFRARTRRNVYDEEAFYGLGLAYFNLGLLDEAVEELTKAARLTPENPHIQAQLAVVLHEQFKDGEAEAAEERDERLERALLLDPRNVEARLLQAQIYLEHGDHGQAMRLLREIELVDPGRAAPLLAIALETEAKVLLLEVLKQRTKMLLWVARLKERGEKALERKHWREVRQVWGELAELDPVASRALMIRFLIQNKRFVPEWVMSQDESSADLVLDGPSADSKRVWMTILFVFLSCLLSSILAAILAPILGEKSVADITGWGDFVFTSLMLVTVTSVGVWAWRRYDPKTDKPSEVDPVEPLRSEEAKASVMPEFRGFMRDDVLAGRVDLEVVRFAANEVLTKLGVPEFPRDKPA